MNPFYLAWLQEWAGMAMLAFAVITFVGGMVGSMLVDLASYSEKKKRLIIVVSLYLLILFVTWGLMALMAIPAQMVPSTYNVSLPGSDQ